MLESSLQLVYLIDTVCSHYVTGSTVPPHTAIVADAYVIKKRCMYLVRIISQAKNKYENAATD